MASADATGHPGEPPATPRDRPFTELTRSPGAGLRAGAGLLWSLLVGADVRDGRDGIAVEVLSAVPGDAAARLQGR